jgi:phosphoribosylformimino-5-aminoimidazole carboxamide ribotide isomerase
MTLARIGSDAGPDFERLAAISRRAENRAVYLAGGARGRADIEKARAAGAAGVLVASALHDGRLSRDDLAALASPPGNAR